MKIVILSILNVLGNIKSYRSLIRINETALNPFDKHLFNYNNLTTINFELYGEISYIM